MKYVFALIAFLFASAAQAQDALVVAGCGSLPQAYTAGSTRQLTVDINGKLCGVAPGSGLPLTGGVITGQFSDTFSGSTSTVPQGPAWMTFDAPNTKAFMLTTLDGANHITRTWDQPTGRMDLFSNSAAGQAVGPAMVLNFNNATPANGDNLGHYAFRGNDSNATVDTYAYVLGRSVTVAAAGLASSLTFGTMNNQPAGAGNAQPNYSVIFDGGAQTWTDPAGLAHIESGTRTVTVAAGSPTQTYNNGATAQNLILSVGAGGVINETGGGGLNLQASNTTGVALTGSLVTLPLPTLVQRYSRSSKTTNYTVLLTDSGAHFDNSGAVAEVDFTLPTSPTLGMNFQFCTRAAQILKVIAPAAAFINVGGTQSASAGNAASAVNGVCLTLENTNANLWTATAVTGTGGSNAGTGAWTVT